MKVDLSDALNEKGHKDYFIIQSKAKNSFTQILKENSTAIILWVLLLIGFVLRDSIIKNEVLPVSFFLYSGLVVLIYTIISFVISAKNNGWVNSVEHYNSPDDAKNELEKIIAKDNLHFGIKNANKSVI
jgi:hypothetical protein